MNFRSLAIGDVSKRCPCQPGYKFWAESCNTGLPWSSLPFQVVKPSGQVGQRLLEGSQLYHSRLAELDRLDLSCIRRRQCNERQFPFLQLSTSMQLLIFSEVLSV